HGWTNERRQGSRSRRLWRGLDPASGPAESQRRTGRRKRKRTAHLPSILVTLLAAALDSSAVVADTARTAPPDSHRVVRHFPAVEATAGRVQDRRSSAPVHSVSPEALRDLPITSLTQALALQPGVVAAGEDLHVRGGRAGETQVTLAGITLNEPLRDRAPELPLLAVERADLLAGGLDPQDARPP